MAKTKPSKISVNLGQPLDSTSVGAQALLNDLQGNILKGHGRENTVHVFVEFQPDKIAEVKALISGFAKEKLTSASLQLQESIDFRKFGIPGGVFGGFLLSKAGYDALGVVSPPADAAFVGGLKGAQAKLNDPPPAAWESGYQGTIHAMILLADDDLNYLRTKARDLITEWRRACRIVAVETGKAIRNDKGDHIEHFGYVDGRSQPLFLQSDIEGEATSRGDGITNWDPSAPLDLVLVQDPNGKDANSFGSYFVFRKLEQNVRGFKVAEEALAVALGLSGDDAERAGAMVVGRFEDGTPLVLQKAEGMHNPVPNNFNYSVDTEGSRCPFHSHIRKTNPRGDTVRIFGVPEKDELGHRIARRGITYGDRPDHPNAPVPATERPTGGVGLLFMCFQSNIANQFEFMQASWANNPDFVNVGLGLDPVIGQGTGGEVPQQWDSGWGQSTAKVAFDFKDFVKMLGGEYFFAPSIGFLRSVG